MVILKEKYKWLNKFRSLTYTFGMVFLFLCAVSSKHVIMSCSFGDYSAFFLLKYK